MYLTSSQIKVKLRPMWALKRCGGRLFSLPGILMLRKLESSYAKILVNWGVYLEFAVQINGLQSPYYSF